MVYTSLFHFSLFTYYSFFSFVPFPFFFCTACTVTADNFSSPMASWLELLPSALAVILCPSLLFLMYSTTISFVLHSFVPFMNELTYVFGGPYLSFFCILSM